MYKRIMKLKRTISAVLCMATLLSVGAVSANAVNTKSADNQISTMCGDVNLDGVVSIRDVTDIQKIITGITTVTGQGKENADAYKDGTISISDATTIAKYIVQSGVQSLPVLSQFQRIPAENICTEPSTFNEKADVCVRMLTP